MWVGVRLGPRLFGKGPRVGAQVGLSSPELFCAHDSRGALSGPEEGPDVRGGYSGAHCQHLLGTKEMHTPVIGFLGVLYLTIFLFECLRQVLSVVHAGLPL